ncbi:hypothetical protein AWQ21_14580 (plasmid) [Picosynechococcus sp. PCC 7003]|uniref:DUF559 domain-containing protein n=1 Tax=Picosynechococcus sp. PCC 7003 TaxID=374981 RepID=UPI000810E9A7|nr:DUF559 domain-containing protein [Picosynechococcus sp. PCC 7003]ANV85757.1 hypothetical protein AWQ21_14580 [Picosynechococcus sp. PCC 7003]
MPEYPDIYIPPRLKQISSAKPELPAPPAKPVKPEHPTKPKWWPPITVGLLCLVATLIIFSNIPVLSLITGGLGIAVTRLIQTQGFRGDLAEYRRLEQEYPRRLTDYEKERRNFQDLKNRLKDPQFVQEYQQKLLNQFKNTIYQPDGYNSNARTGRCEGCLYRAMNKHLPGKIIQNAKLDIPNYSYPYSPDVCYVYDDIYFDIEVDEPYTPLNGDGDYKPIHGWEESKEHNRNNFFLNKGWVVIRFSEEQVARYPDSCVKEIAQVVEQITQEPLPASLVNVENLNPQPRWTIEEAEQLADRNHRQTYDC